MVLQATFGGDGLSCFDCNLEVAGASLRLDDDSLDALRSWRDGETALYSLWLASGKHESFAAMALRDARSWTAKLARRVQVSIERRIPCWIQLFQDPEQQESGLPRKCPRCSATPMAVRTRIGSRAACRKCRLTWWQKNRLRAEDAS